MGRAPVIVLVIRWSLAGAGFDQLQPPNDATRTDGEPVCGDELIGRARVSEFILDSELATLGPKQ